ncbi:unnamed protein product [Dibothriocephalus latus]|uniref:Uncharacterized protein n=1 Tax=Dibothriocephalus latus TaxID=60516 RepID=A0A3P7NVM3_DIBLA|nr:unnamed protein product [Dibothriocephalus latus]
MTCQVLVDAVDQRLHWVILPRDLGVSIAQKYLKFVDVVLFVKNNCQPSFFGWKNDNGFVGIGTGIAHIPEATISRQPMRPKDPVPVNQNSGVIDCHCGITNYVGETVKRVLTRMHQHELAVRRNDKLSLVAAHASIPGHDFDFGTRANTGSVGRPNLTSFAGGMAPSLYITFGGGVICKQTIT